MNTKNIDRIARALGGTRRGAVSAGSGVFSASQLAAEVSRRFRAPSRGGRATDPSWDDKRLIPLKKEILRDLARLADDIGHQSNVHMEPMQLAAILLEQRVNELKAKEKTARR